MRPSCRPLRPCTPLRHSALSDTGLQGTLPASWDCVDASRCGLGQLRQLWLVSLAALVRGAARVHGWRTHVGRRRLPPRRRAPLSLLGQPSLATPPHPPPAPPQDGNNLTGPVPPSWASHPALEYVYVQPGNPGLCLPEGVDFPFR